MAFQLFFSFSAFICSDLINAILVSSGLGLGQEVTRDLIALSLADSEREWGYNQDSSIDWQAVSNVACKFNYGYCFSCNSV